MSAPNHKVLAGAFESAEFTQHERAAVLVEAQRCVDTLEFPLNLVAHKLGPAIPAGNTLLESPLIKATRSGS